MLVHKFGGTSVENAARFQAAAELVLAHGRPAVVVTSAMAGVTDRLLAAAQAAEAGRDADARAALDELRIRHRQAADAIAAGAAARESLRGRLGEGLDELAQLLHGVRLLRELTPRSRDLILSFGERLAALLFAAALDERGAGFRPVDARDFLRTDDGFGEASVDFDASRRLARAQLLPPDEREIPVVTGFIAATADGLTTTLGRGGSDYTASLLGAFLDADEIWIWTDVDGVMTADPRVAPEARTLEAITYREAAEMAFFGSKVVHPRTMIPAVAAGIPVRIRNSFHPDRPGTRIAPGGGAAFQGVKTVASIGEMAMVTVEGRGMAGVTGIAARVFGAVARAGVNIYMISQSSSEQNISFLVRAADGPQAIAALEAELAPERLRRNVDPIDAQAPVGILTIVGEGMKGTPGISQRLFTALGRARINVLAIAQGSSELSVSVVVAQDDLHRAVGAVHTRFGLTRDTHVFLLGKGAIGRALLRQLLDARDRLRREHGLSLRVIGVAGRDEWLFHPLGLSEDRLRRIAAGESLHALGGAPRPADEEIIERLRRTQRLDVALVDATAAETGPLQLRALQAGFHVVTANKKPLSGPLAMYRALREAAAAQGVGLHFETTFGAGLPVLFTLQDLLATHDRIHRVSGCFSGTLGFICTGLQEGRPFADLVREAKARGFTEPDPRDDLSGLDVARKALIIAREIGAAIEMSDVKLEGLLPPEFAALPDVAAFLARVPELNASFAERAAAARAAGKTLRFVAEITPTAASVGLRAVPLESAEGQLFGPDNILVYQTDRYREHALVIRGPGAGAEVTAAGVFGDLLKVARRT